MLIYVKAILSWLTFKIICVGLIQLMLSLYSQLMLRQTADYICFSVWFIVRWESDRSWLDWAVLRTAACLLSIKFYFSTLKNTSVLLITFLHPGLRGNQVNILRLGGISPTNKNYLLGFISMIIPLYPSWI